jgi:hypothetical protein
VLDRKLARLGAIPFGCSRELRLVDRVLDDVNTVEGTPCRWWMRSAASGQSAAMRVAWRIIAPTARPRHPAWTQ